MGDQGSGQPSSSSDRKRTLLDLPPELLCAITEHLPRLPFPIAPRLTVTPHLNKPFLDTHPAVQRTPTLRALSSTCRALRAVALPLAWESIESVSIPKPSDQQDDTVQELTNWDWLKAKDSCYAHLNAGLVEQLLLVTIARPSLAPYVRNIVFLCGNMVSVVAQRLGKLLPLLPNLETIQILSISELSEISSLLQDPDEFAKTFYTGAGVFDVNLPCVRRLAIPANARVLVECCPNLEVMAAVIGQRQLQDAKDIYEEVALRYPKMKQFIGFPFEWEVMIDDLIENCPELTHIRLNDCIRYKGGVRGRSATGLPTSEIIRRFSALRSLRHIHFFAHGTTNTESLFREDQNAIAECLLVLGKASSIEPQANPNLGYGEKGNIGSFFLNHSLHSVLPPWLIEHLGAQGTGIRQSPNSRTRTLVVDIAQLRKVIIFNVELSHDPSILNLTSIKVGRRASNPFEEVYGLEEILGVL